MYDERNNWLLAGALLLFLLLVYLYRRNRWTLSLLIAGAGVYLALALTPAHEAVILMSGHGVELLVAGSLIYRVIGDVDIRNALRRPAYAFLGAFIILQCSTFSYQLVSSSGFRHTYEHIKGAGFEMDLTRLAQNLYYIDVMYLALVFFVVSLMVPVISFSCYRYRDYLELVQASIGNRKRTHR